MVVPARIENCSPTGSLPWPDLVFRVDDFSLDRTLESGQCFRWRRLTQGEYWGVVGNCALRAFQEGNQLRVSLCGGILPDDFARFVCEYFDLSRPYRKILQRFRRDGHFAQTSPRRAELHILQQDPFEILISFIISANNHIPRIRSIIERLCHRYGESMTTRFGQVSRFPAPESLAGAKLENLRADCGLGYRDKYVLAAARTMANDVNLYHWKDLPTLELRRRLMDLDGVGEKVADCILLFGFHRFDAFPIDTWVRRAMIDLYFPKMKPTDRVIREVAAVRFGEFAGVAQQYLFVRKRADVRRLRSGE